MTRRVVLLFTLTLFAGCGPGNAPPSNSEFKVPQLPPGRQNDGMTKPEKK